MVRGSGCVAGLPAAGVFHVEHGGSSGVVGLRWNQAPFKRGRLEAVALGMGPRAAKMIRSCLRFPIDTTLWFLVPAMRASRPRWRRRASDAGH